MHEFVAANRDKVELFLDQSKLGEVLARKKPTKYFWWDMTDGFMDEYPAEWLDLSVAVMSLTSHHTHLVLTKRPERLRDYFRDPMTMHRIEECAGRRFMHIKGPACVSAWPLPNLWLGVSAENQQYADARIPLLIQTPAAVRFVSYEPALEALILDADWLWPRCEFCGRHWRDRSRDFCDWPDCHLRQTKPHSLLDWIIVGGESGPKARSFDIQWARDTIAACKAAGMACFVKQLGRYPEQMLPGTIRPMGLGLRDSKGKDPSEWPADLRVREFPMTHCPGGPPNE